jgi:predicted transcriptional regulator
LDRVFLSATTRRRNNEELCSAILEVSSKNRKATRLEIMAGAFINYGIATAIIEELQRGGLVEFHPDTKTYTVTQR